jgi:vacuolar-type H+-ATPase subunit H
MIFALDRPRKARDHGHIAAARESAKKSLETAQKEAARIKSIAHEDGLREGQAQYQEIVLVAEQEAKELVTQAERLAEELGERGDLRMEQAVQATLRIIMGLEEEVKGV